MKKKKMETHPHRRAAGDESKIEAYDYHLPVLFKESLDYLITEKCGIYVDGTLGGGGHAGEIIQRLEPGGKFLAFDKDTIAIKHCERKFADELEKGPESKIILINDCYGMACSIAEEWGKIDGLLLDLGVSSMQLDSKSIGLSYRVNSRLDMRFGSKGISAEDLLNSASEDAIERILRDYGEEPFARVIARRIGEFRRASSLKTTFELRMIVEEAVPPKLRFKSLSRVFQAVRIAVNKELDILADTLRNIPDHVKPGGRIVVISYHSLEDRIVKNIFKELSYKAPKRSYAREDVLDIANAVPKLKILTPKPVVPSEEELERNPRSRSAKLRVAELVLVDPSKLHKPGDIYSNK